MAPMLRITELRLPLKHTDEELHAAVLTRLNVPAHDVLGVSIFKRSYDARKKSHIVLIYTLDCRLRDDVVEQAVFAAHAGDAHIRPTPDTSYQFVGHAPADFRSEDCPRPVVVGFGPCGIFAALILAQMGLRPIVLERGKEVRQRTKDTWGLWRQSVLDPESNVQFGEGGA